MITFDLTDNGADLTRAAAMAIIGGKLGQTSKMPGQSHGLSADRCKTGGKLAQVPGSTCSICYAQNGNYIFPSVRIGHERRYEGLQHPRWVGAMVRLLEGETFFRWNDSGDLQNVQHLAKIAAVAFLTKKVRHWVATRESEILRQYVKKVGAVPDNLIIRLSATMIDGPAPRWWPWTSSVTAGEASCPAPRQDHKCGGCRTCWDKAITTVSYQKH